MLTRPDAASGRRGKPSPSPVARLALERASRCCRRTAPNSEEFVAQLTELAPECCAVVAYGALVPRRRCSPCPRHGWVNLHFSLLPAWRGAAPVQHAIAAGDDGDRRDDVPDRAGLDTGPVYGVVTETVRPDRHRGRPAGPARRCGAGLLVTTLDGIADGALTPVPQPADGVTLAPKITVEDARVRWDAAGARRRAADPRRHAEPRAPGRCSASCGSSSARCRLDAGAGRPLAPGRRSAVDRTRCPVGHRRRIPVRAGQVQPPGQEADGRPPTGRAARRPRRLRRRRR